MRIGLLLFCLLLTGVFGLPAKKEKRERRVKQATSSCTREVCARARSTLKVNGDCVKTPFCVRLCRILLTGLKNNFQGIAERSQESNKGKTTTAKIKCQRKVLCAILLSLINNTNKGVSRIFQSFQNLANKLLPGNVSAVLWKR